MVNLSWANVKSSGGVTIPILKNTVVIKPFSELKVYKEPPIQAPSAKTSSMKRDDVPEGDSEEVAQKKSRTRK